MIRLIAGFFALLTSALSGGPATALSARTFLASTGSDANPCSIAAPCRTLGAAIAAVVDGGDVIIQDSGGYGENVVIAKSVSVIAPAGIAARLRVSSSSGTGVTVNGTGISVVLDGLGISGPNGGTGIRFQNGRLLSLRNIDINIAAFGFSYGVDHVAGNGSLAMSNSVVRNANYCISVEGQTMSAAFATIIQTQAEGCEYGYVAAEAAVVVKHSSAIGSSSCLENFRTFSGGTIVLDNVVSTTCQRGLRAGGNLLTVSNSVIAGNTVAGSSLGGGRTFGNNRIAGNGDNTLADFTAMAEQ